MVATQAGNSGQTLPSERSDQDWLADLRSPDPGPAISELREFLVRGLRAALSQDLGSNQNLENSLEDFVQDALLKILANLDGFRGESRFTTWAQKISINVALTELRRRRWRNISLQEMIDRFDGGDYTPAILTDPAFSPEQQALLASSVTLIDRVINHELTEKQRDALVAVVLRGVPMEEVAQRMGTNRNALYKLIYDARKRLKRRLAAAGFSTEDILALFEAGV